MLMNMFKGFYSINSYVINFDKNTLTIDIGLDDGSIFFLYKLNLKVIFLNILM